MWRLCQEALSRSVHTAFDDSDAIGYGSVRKVKLHSHGFFLGKFLFDIQILYDFTCVNGSRQIVFLEFEEHFRKVVNFVLTNLTKSFTLGHSWTLSSFVLRIAFFKGDIHMRVCMTLVKFRGHSNFKNILKGKHPPPAPSARVWFSSYERVKKLWKFCFLVSTLKSGFCSFCE